MTLYESPGCQCGIDERVQLPILRDEPLGADGHVTIVERPRRVGLDETGHHHGIIPRAIGFEHPDRRAVRDRFGHRGELGRLRCWRNV